MAWHLNLVLLSLMHYVSCKHKWKQLGVMRWSDLKSFWGPWPKCWWSKYKQSNFHTFCTKRCFLSRKGINLLIKYLLLNGNGPWLNIRQFFLMIGWRLLWISLSGSIYTRICNRRKKLDVSLVIYVRVLSEVGSNRKGLSFIKIDWEKTCAICRFVQKALII